jgi:hypothetical protein
VAGDPLRVYLRRDRLNGAAQVRQNRFLHLPVRTVTPSFPVQPIAPQLPGNDSTTVYGASSPNFGFNIGRQQLTLNVAGTFQPLDAVDYPSLPTGPGDFDVILNAQGDTVHGSIGVSDGSPFPTLTAPTRVFEVQDAATATATTARKNRQRFLEWAADQALGGIANKYANFRLGVRDWVNDGKWVEFKGFVVNPSVGGEEAGLFEQFDYTFTFLVCDTIEVTTTGA